MSDIPVLTPGQPMYSSPAEPVDSATRRLYEQVDPAVVQVVTDLGSGSGFFANRNGDVVTDAHVIFDSGWQDVILGSGRHVPAKVTKIDDVHDLAVLHVDGLEPGTQPFLQLGSTQNLAPGSKVWAFGHPLGERQDYISPGTFQSAMPFTQWTSSLWHHTGGRPEDVTQAGNRPFLDVAVHTEQGNSGGPLVDAEGHVLGVVDMGRTNVWDEMAHRGTITGLTPVENVQTLLNSNQNQFNISYGNSGMGSFGKQWLNEPVMTTAEIGFGVALPTHLYSTLARQIPADLNAARTAGQALPEGLAAAAGSPRSFLGAVKSGGLRLGAGAFFAFNAYEDANTLLGHNSNWQDRVNSGVSLGFDTVGLAGTAASFVPSLSQYGTLGMRVGAAGLLANYLFIQPGLDDFNHVVNDRDTGSRISHGVALPFDALGAAGAAALAFGKINPRLGLLAMGVGIAGHYLSQFLPVHASMSVTRSDGDPTPPLRNH